MTKKPKRKPDDEWLDDEGYPTDKALDRVSDWEKHYDEMLAFVRSIWRYAASGYYAEAEGEEDPSEKVYRLSTAGWSGNEEIIDALRDNKIFWALCWYSSTRGGHYVFKVPAMATRAKWGQG